MSSADLPVGGVVLFPGASGKINHHLFCYLEDKLNVPVGLAAFAYTEAGKRRPPPRVERLLPEVVEASQRWADEWNVDASSIVLGGRSMGGRCCSLAVAEGLSASGLLLFSYPLHPPGKPAKLRVEHFDRIDCPVFLIQGERDPFGRQHEFDSHLGAIAGPVRQLWVEGNHDPKPTQNDLIFREVQDWLG